MSYKLKFEASEQKAYYKNIATKILREMSSLRSVVENSKTAQRRWVWELVQNAKDVHSNKGVKIKIEYDLDGASPFVNFMHDGIPFSTDNIRFLIEQVSSKDRKKDDDGKQKSTGKFGTGFLTTHLLSEIVKIEGVAKEPGLDYRKFTLSLDRSGFEPEQIIEAVKTAKSSVENLDENPVYIDYNETDFNTTFSYSLDDNVSLQVAKAGLNDLANCIIYTLAFVNEINNVEVSDFQSTLSFRNSNSISQLGENIKIVSINTGNKNKELSELCVVVLTKGFTNLAIPIQIEDNSIKILPIEDHIPRLFCDFPLIGTEKFPFPAVVNSPNFNPTDPRDGIFLTTSQRANPLSDENKSIMIDAVELYFELLKYASENGWKNLHLFAKIPSFNYSFEWLDATWFNDKILNPIHNRLLYTPIVTNANNKLVSILKSDDTPNIWFPNKGTKETRLKIWSLAYSWFPSAIPQKSDIELWNKVIWDECGKLTINQFAKFIIYFPTIEEFAKFIKNENVFSWLNKFYEVIRSEEAEYDAIINHYAIFPNQNGTFCKKSQLYKDTGNIGDEFKDVLKLLNKDVRDWLSDERIEEEFDEALDKTYAVKEIISEVNEKTTDREIAKHYNQAFRKLLIWFRQNPDEAQVIFPTLYKSKHLLYDDDEILENIDKAEQLDDLLTDFHVNNIDELRQLILSANDKSKTFLPITQEIIASMGITNVEEWQKAIQDKDLAKLFSHKSTPTPEMFLYAQSHIQQAKENIKKYLGTLAEYDLKEMDDTTAPTILAGIVKNKEIISIVTRPAYDNQVIIYYDSERDILDFEPSELWVDDGIKPRRISLGHILKSSKIVKFPI